MIWNHLYITYSARKGSRILCNKANLVLVCKKNSEEFNENSRYFRISSKMYQNFFQQEICHISFCYKMKPSFNKVSHQFEQGLLSATNICSIRMDRRAFGGLFLPR